MSWSYWEEEHLLRDIQYVIVGAGLTGLQTAIQIKESDPKARVVVLDRSYWSQGASLKNAGFACFANVGEMLDDLEHSSQEEVFRLAKERYKGLEDLKNRFGANEIGYIPCGTKEIFFDRNKSDLHTCIDALQGFNTVLYELIGKDNVFTFSSNTEIKESKGSIVNSYEGLLNTAKLYERVLDFAIDLGVRVIGGIKVDQYHVTDRVVLEIDGGHTLQAETLILCMNGFTDTLLDTEIVPARGQVIVTEKIPGLDMPSAYMFNKGYYYWREIDGRILLGGARNIDKEIEETADFGVNEKIITDLQQFAESLVQREVKIEYQWSGIMGMGKTKTPKVLEIEPKVYLAAGLGGMGVALSSRVAQSLKEKIFS